MEPVQMDSQKRQQDRLQMIEDKDPTDTPDTHPWATSFFSTSAYAGG